MTATFKTCAGAAALLLAGAALAQADTITAAADTSANQIVVRDAASGALRAATALEARALGAGTAAASGRARLDTEQRSHFSGARGVRLSNDFLSHSVLARLPDGSVVEQCFHTPEEAAFAHKALATTKAPAALPTE